MIKIAKKQEGWNGWTPKVINLTFFILFVILGIFSYVGYKDLKEDIITGPQRTCWIESKTEKVEVPATKQIIRNLSDDYIRAHTFEFLKGIYHLNYTPTIYLCEVGIDYSPGIQFSDFEVYPSLINHASEPKICMLYHEWEKCEVI